MSNDILLAWDTVNCKIHNKMIWFAGAHRGGIEFTLSFSCGILDAHWHKQLFLMFLLIFPETGRVCVHLKHISLRTEWRISVLLKSTKSAKMGHLWLMQIHIHIMFIFIFSCCNHLSYLVVYALLSMYMYLALTMKKGGLFWEYPVLSHF